MTSNLSNEITTDTNVPLTYRALILTALPLEYTAIQIHLQGLEQKKHPQGNIYEIGKTILEGIEWNVCIGKTGPHNPAAGIETERAINFFRPNIAFFVGVAGGLKDAKIGDVVISSKISDYEYGKDEEGFKPRFATHTPNFHIIQVADIVSREQDWKKRIKIDISQIDPKIHVGPIVSGEKVLGDATSHQSEQIKQNHSDALAAEMEGFGFFDAVWRNGGIDALIIRGISDYCNKDKSTVDAGGSQEIAAACASAVAFEFLANYSKFHLKYKQLVPAYDTPKEIPKSFDVHKQIQEQKQFEPLEVPNQQKIPVSLSITDISENSRYKVEIDEIKQLVVTFQPDKALNAITGFKETKWSSATDFEKYRVLGNEGLAEIQLNNNKKGAELLLEALNFNPDDELALGNAAYGCLVNGDYERAIDLTKRVIDKNPNSSRAYSVFIQSKAHIEPIEKIIPTIPEAIKNSQEVAGAIGQCFFNSGNFNESSKWFEISVKDAKKDALSFKAIYASSLLNKVKNDERSLSGLQITKEMRQDLEKSKSYFDDVIECISHSLPMQKNHYSWFIERGIVKRMLGLIDESSRDFIEAYNLNPTSPIAIYHKGLSDSESGDFHESEIQSEKILWEKSTPGSLWLYLHSLKSQKKNDEGIAKIGEFEQKISTEEQKNLIDQFLILFYLDKGEQFYEKAESLAYAKYENDKTDVTKSIELLKTYQITKNLKELERIIDEIGTRDLSNIPVLQQIEIADIFYDAKHHIESSKIYTRLVDPSENTSLTQKLISSLFFSDDHKGALDCSRILHLHHGPQPYSSRIELAIYLEIGDLPEAQKLCDQYLEKYPDDYEMKLNKARVDFRANDLSQVISFLEIPYDFSGLSYESGSKLANLFLAVSRFDDAITVSYAVRNKFLDNPQAHLDYIQLILDVADRSPLLNKPEKVDLDTVVQLEDPLRKITSYFICSEGSTDSLFAIKLDPFSVLGAKIIDTIEGVKISFDAPIGENFVIVKNIFNKYVYAFQESVNDFSQKFIGHPGIFRIPIGSGNDGNVTKGDIENIRTLVERNQKKIDTLLDYYKKRQFTISGIAQELNRDIFTVCSTISQNADAGIVCCYHCTPQESEMAKQQLECPVRLVIDPVALYTIYSDTKFGDLIVKKYGKFKISQSTVDLLRISIFNLSGFSSQRHMTLTTTGDSLAGYEITAEQVAIVKQHYEKFLNWLEKNCEILPCYESLSLDPNKKREYESLFGRASLDTMLLASRENTLLYTDDGLIQGVANQLYNVKSVWSQILLLKLEDENKNSAEILDETAIRLLQQHHFPPIINGIILFNAAKKARWDYGSPFTEVVQLLQDIRLAPAISVTTGAEFVIRLWIERIDSDSRNYLILIVLKAITQNREKTLFCRAFMACIQNSTELFDFEKSEIIDLIIFYHDFLL